jgi:RNA-directed DNA polymerase
VVIVKKLNPILRGWFKYFKHGDCQPLSSLDAWVRMRLRSILRRRKHRKGRGRGYDHVRWPNAYFVSLGLFTMTTAWERARRSR